MNFLEFNLSFYFCAIKLRFLYLIEYYNLSGITKPTSVEQPVLIDIVLRFVQFVPDFSAADIAWVRSMKTSKFGVLNTQCRSVVMASRVKSTFASLVKTKPIPAFIGKVNFISGFILFGHVLVT